MKITLDDLVSRFHMQKHEAGMFFLMLAMLPPGGVFDAVNGRIEKVDEETLKLVVDEKTFKNAADDFMEETVETYDNMFGHLPMS